ncbi:MAG: zf-TFIIB domain-containing protein [Chloroflexi bacterium]|nr:zf-TFIIB domain-containing protein [Chloroflexota bacterium]
MKCPSCKSTAIVIEYEKIELDYCAGCGGLWFDKGELELLLDSIEQGTARKYVADMLAQPEAETREEKRKCPICNRAMKKTLIGGNAKIMIDACSLGHGLWFDGGELNQLLDCIGADASLPESARDRVTAYLNDVFKFRPDKK